MATWKRKTKWVTSYSWMARIDLKKIKDEAKERVQNLRKWWVKIKVEADEWEEFNNSLRNRDEEIKMENELEKVLKSNESEERKLELIRLLEILDNRKKYYSILETQLQPHQFQVIWDFLEKWVYDWKTLPKNKFILFQGWNGAGKTALLMYVTVLLALWTTWKKYWLPYIWSKKNIRLVTKSSANVTWTFQPYLLWDYSKFRIPPDEVVKVRNDNWVIKEIHLANKCVIHIKTYDQGRERVQWGNPDFVWVDEEPIDKWVWDELMLRVRENQSQMLISMTPLSWLTPIYSFFYEWADMWKNERRKKYLVSSLENKHADHSWVLLLDEETQKMRLYGQFVPPTWLVYKSFIRKKHMIEHINPEELWDWVRYYCWIDFWVNHPTWFVIMAVDLDWHIYIFDGFKWKELSLDEMASMIKEKTRKYNIEYIIWDTAAKRERFELWKLWVKILPADKFSKWENNQSNRNSWITKVNTLFKNNKLFISENMKDLVDELEKHAYKEWNRNWDVIKENDDLLDAVRYCIFSLKEWKPKTEAQKKFETKYSVNYNKRGYYAKKYKKIY